MAASGGTPESCGGELYPNVGVPLSNLPNGIVIRFWAFQNFFTSNGSFNWTNLDQVLAFAAAHNDKVIPVLSNQYNYCDGVAKDLAWYQNGYETVVDPGDIVPYLQYVKDIVSRYADNPLIAMWQMVNEGEAVNSDGSCNEPAALSALLAFSNNVGGVIHSIDPHHLVSLGVLAGYSGSGAQWCGSANGDFQTLMASTGNDVCDFHDYGYPNDPMGMPFGPNLAAALEMCHADGKPLMVAETGILADAASNLPSRATEFEAKFAAQFNAGVAGELMWAWTPSPNYANPENAADYGVFPNDPSLGVIRTFASSLGTTSSSPTTFSLTKSSSISPTKPSVNHPKPTINVSAVALGSNYNVLTTVHCAVATCTGALESTKAITTEVEIGRSKKYGAQKTVVELGRIHYSMAAGSQRQYSIRLNAAGVSILHADNGRRLSCELTVTSAAGAQHVNVSLRIT
jgi:hypothetical protein